METEVITEPETPQAPPEEKKEIEVPKKSVSAIPVNKDGQLEPQNSSQLASLALQMLKGGMVPKGYNTVEKIITAWNLAASLKLAPALAIRNIAVIEGSPSLFGDLPLALVQRSGELVFFEEFLFDAQYKKLSFENKNLDVEVYGAVCIMQRKGQEKHSFSFTVEDAKTAGLWNRKSQSGGLMPWSAYPKVMLIRRARSMAIKSEFAHVLSGAAITEYDLNELPDMRDVSDLQSESGAAKLNKVFEQGAPSGSQS